MKKTVIIIGVCMVLCAGFLLVDTVSAQTTAKDVIGQLDAGSSKAGYGVTKDAVDPRIMASRLITAFMGLLGIVVTYLFVMAGYYFVSSHGNDEKVSKARKMMQGAVIGLIIILISFSISYFVGKTAQEAVQIEGPAATPQQYQ